MEAVLLIQDVQLLCFTIVFGILAVQRWDDRTRRWLWYGFLANAVGAVLDLAGNRLPSFISHGFDLAMIPLSYAFLNIALVYFDRRRRQAVWISSAIIVLALPFLLAWRNHSSMMRSDALGDLIIALECVVTVALLTGGKEQSTRAPRHVMSAFLSFFVVLEAARFIVAFPLHTDPDSFRRLEVASLVTYVVNTSLLPLAFIWLLNARLESELLRQSMVDALTGVLNRRGLEQALDRELARFRRYGEDLCVVMFDLDRFKAINDRYGHITGDKFLVRIAELVTRRLRETDVIGRFGGEEFLLLLPHTGLADSVRLLEDSCRSIREHSEWLAQEDRVRATASFGVACTNGRQSVTAEELLREADAAVYLAKQNGRDQICFWSARRDGGEPMHSFSTAQAEQ